MKKSDLRLIVILGAKAFHDSGFVYDPNNNHDLVSQFGLEPGIGPRDKLIRSYPLPVNAEGDIHWESELPAAVPANNWHHMFGCECSECRRGWHYESGQRGAYKVVHSDGQVLYEVSEGGWSGD